MIHIFTGLLFLLFYETRVSENFLPLLSPIFGGLLLLRGGKKLRDTLQRASLLAKAAGVFLFLLFFSVLFQWVNIFFLSEIRRQLFSWLLAAAVSISDAALIWAAAETAAELFSGSARGIYLTAYSCGFGRLFASLLFPFPGLQLWVRLAAFLFGLLFLAIFGHRLRRVRQNLPTKQ